MALLWIVVVAEAAVIAVQMKLIGDLWQRLPPSGARGLAEGLEIGSVAPRLHIRGEGSDATIPRMGRPTLLTFMRSTCESCARLLPALERFATRERDLDVVAIYLDQPTGRLPLAQSLLATGAPEGVAAFNVTTTPFGVMIDEEGRVMAAGLANTMEHLESLADLSNRRPGEPQHA